MKITTAMIALSLVFILLCSEMAFAQQPPSEEEAYTSITEIGGLSIANQEAEAWNSNAELIMVSISAYTILHFKDGGAEQITTAWAYTYRGDSKYLRIVVDTESYEMQLAQSTEKISEEEARQFELLDKSPLEDWQVISWNALEVVSLDYDMSLEKGDRVLDWYLCMTEWNEVNRPVWHISITDGITGIKTSYMVDATNGDILEIQGPRGGTSQESPKTTPPESTPSTPPADDQGIHPGVIAAIVTGACAILAALITIIPRLRRRHNQS